LVTADLWVVIDEAFLAHFVMYDKVWILLPSCIRLKRLKEYFINFAIFVNFCIFFVFLSFYIHLLGRNKQQLRRQHKNCGKIVFGIFAYQLQTWLMFAVVFQWNMPICHLSFDASSCLIYIVA